MGLIANQMLLQALSNLFKKGKKSGGHKHSSGHTHDAGRTSEKTPKKEQS